MINMIWDVNVLRGATGIEPAGPHVKFGVPQATLGPDGISDATVPLVYSEVSVRTVANWAVIETVTMVPDPEDERRSTGVTAILREMNVVTAIEFTGWGNIRIEGLETREDGALVLAIWEIEPAPPSDGAGSP